MYGESKLKVGLQGDGLEDLHNTDLLVEAEFEATAEVEFDGAIEDGVELGSLEDSLLVDDLTSFLSSSTVFDMFNHNSTIVSAPKNKQIE